MNLERQTRIKKATFADEELQPRKWGEGFDPSRLTRSSGGFGGLPQPDCLDQKGIQEFMEHGAGTRASFQWSFKYYWRALSDMCLFRCGVPSGALPDSPLCW